MAELTSRELVWRTLRFAPTPRVPRQLWWLPWAEQQCRVELEAMRQAFPDDIIPAEVTYPALPCMRGDPYAVGTCVDEWGCEFVNIQAGAIGEVKRPLVESYASDLDKVRPPDAWLAVSLDEAHRACGQSNRFMLSGVCLRLFERMQFLRGTENLYVDLIEQPAGLFTLRDRVHEWNLAMIDRWAGSDVDGIMWMDDWGSQQSLLMSPSLWRSFFKPCYREYVDRIHAGGKACFVHSDGHIDAVYEDLIEIGVHAINSQLFCMDIESIGQRFGGRITFWGEIDRQQLLPYGSTDDIRKAVQRVADALYDGHGGVIAQCEFGVGARPENVRKVFETWDQIGAAKAVAGSTQGDS